MGAPPGGTPLDIAAVIDRVLRRNINFPFRALVNGASLVTLLDHYLSVSAAAGNATVTLPSAVTVGAGMGFSFIRIDGSANSVTITPAGGQTINGASSATIVLQYGVVVLVSDGANWLLFASPGTFALATDVFWTFPAQLAVDQNANLYTLVAERAMAFVGVDAKVNVAPAGASIIIDWAINGIVNVNLRTTIAAGATFAQVAFPFSLAINDTLQPAIVQIGAQTPGQTALIRARGQ
jgi:endoglucanase Acf2